MSGTGAGAPLKPGLSGSLEPEDEQAAPPKANRHRMPEERLSITHKFSVGGHEGYLTVGLYKDGMPGEIFITMAKEGSTVSGLMDSFACAVSIGLQHGVPLKLLCEKFAHTRFEPSGWSHNPDIGFAKSIMDYIFRWLQLRFLTGQQQALFDGLRPKYFGAPPVGTPEEERPEVVRRFRRSCPLLVRHHLLQVCHHPLLCVIPSRSRGTCSFRFWHRRWLRPRCRRPERTDRHGRRPNLLHLRRHHDAKWKLLPMYELRKHEWLLVGRFGWREKRN